MLHEEEASTFVLNEGTVRSKKQKHGDERRGLGGRWEDGRTALVRQRAARARSSANIGASSVDAPGVHPMGPERKIGVLFNYQPWADLFLHAPLATNGRRLRPCRSARQQRACPDVYQPKLSSIAQR